MPDIDERFNKIDKRFDAVDERFRRVDERFDAVDERFDGLERRLDGVEKSVVELRGEVGGLGQRVHKLQVLVESHDVQIRQIAEVQSHHGKQLEEIQKALKPLGEIHDFVRLVASDHERRISALEKRSGQ